MSLFDVTKRNIALMESLDAKEGMLWQLVNRPNVSKSKIELNRKFYDLVYVYFLYDSRFGEIYSFGDKKSLEAEKKQLSSKDNPESVREKGESLEMGKFSVARRDGKNPRDSFFYVADVQLERPSEDANAAIVSSVKKYNPSVGLFGSLLRLVGANV